MGAGNDFFFTGGGFSDWSGGSAGRFSSGGGSSGGGGSNQPGPNDWKYGCGCMVVVVIAVILFACWDTIYYKWFYREEVTTEQCDTIAERDNDFFEDEFELDTQLDSIPVPATSTASNITKPSKSSSRSYHSSRSYFYGDDDEYDEDGMYKDEDEDIKDKRQYDDYDDDEADDWDKRREYE